MSQRNVEKLEQNEQKRRPREMGVACVLNRNENGTKIFENQKTDCMAGGLTERSSSSRPLRLLRLRLSLLCQIV